MKSFKNILKSLSIMVLLFIIETLLITVFGYFNIINYKLLNTIKMILVIITFIIGGFIIGKKSSKKGWLEGLKLSTFITAIMLIFSLFLKYFKIEYLIYLTVLIISGVLGSMIGINKK